MTTPTRPVSFALALCLVAGTTFGGGLECWCGKPHRQVAARDGVDPESGRDRRNYPPHLPADYTHMSLDIRIADMNTPRLDAVQHLSFTALGESLSSMTLDAKGLTIAGVECRGRAVRFTHDGAKLAIFVDPPLPVGESATLDISYGVSNPQFGLIWTPEDAAHPGRAAQLHTQGEPETNSYWFPCHDFPNDKLTSEVTVTLPAGFLVSSNGQLAEHRKLIRTVETNQGAVMKAFERFRWVQNKPHAPYLVTLVAGKFDVVDVGDRTLSMPVYVPPGKGRDARAVFARTKDMVEYFSRVLDEPYPWDRYAQLSVWNFGWGGMENTSATTLHDNVAVPADLLGESDQDGLIAHELAHQWFGDLLTCNSWEHIWLNEGFATFMNTLWSEARLGVDQYLAEMLGTFDGIIGGDHAEAPGALPMASKVYDDPWDTFGRPANPYGKGCSILHMLRVKLGDDVFFRGMARYIDSHKFGTVETADFRRALEEVSGESLEQFFSQWVFRPGVPHLKVTPVWDAAAGVLTLTVEQTQRIDGDNPAFEFDLAFAIDTGNTTPVRATLASTGRSTSIAVPLPAAPVFVAPNPDLGLLASIDISQAETAWVSQLRGGPTLPSRLRAARSLATGDSSGDAVAVMRSMVLDRSQPVSLRTELLRSLVARRADADVRALLTTATDCWELREATTNAASDLLGRWGDDAEPDARAQLLSQLAARARKDQSLKVRCAAVRALGRAKSADHLPVIRTALKTDSWADSTRQAGLDAIASFDTPESFNAARSLTAPGPDSRTRASAISIVVSLAKHDPEGAFKCVSELTGDTETRTRDAACEGLVNLGDARGEPILSKLLETAQGPEAKRQRGRWLADLRAKLK